jgi:hypothetical protein
LITTSAGQDLNISASLSTGRVVTDLAIHPDDHQIVLRTYRDLFLFQRDQAGTLTPSGIYCDILGHEPQGEGVTWLDDHNLLLISERGIFASGTIHLAKCSSTK